MSHQDEQDRTQIRCMREPVSDTLYIVPHVPSQKHSSLFSDRSCSMLLLFTHTYVHMYTMYPVNQALSLTDPGSFISVERSEPPRPEAIRSLGSSRDPFSCTPQCHIRMNRIEPESMEQLFSEKREPCFCESTCGTMDKVSDTGSLMHLTRVRSCSS